MRAGDPPLPAGPAGATPDIVGGDVVSRAPFGADCAADQRRLHVHRRPRAATTSTPHTSTATAIDVHSPSPTSTRPGPTTRPAPRTASTRRRRPDRPAHQRLDRRRPSSAARATCASATSTRPGLHRLRRAPRARSPPTSRSTRRADPRRRARRLDRSTTDPDRRRWDRHAGRIDVRGRNITLTAGDNGLGQAGSVSGFGGIGMPTNFLEIDVDANGGPLGVLRAFDTAADDDQTAGIYLDEVIGDLKVHGLHRGDDSLSTGNVSLRRRAGSIVDARNGGAGTTRRRARPDDRHRRPRRHDRRPGGQRPRDRLAPRLAGRRPRRQRRRRRRSKRRRASSSPRPTATCASCSRTPPAATSA